MTFSILDIGCNGINLKLTMRDFKLTQNLLALALKHADAKQIRRVNLLIGPFCEEREKAIHYFWRDLAKGSFGEGADLHFQHAPAETKCFDCTGTFHLDEETSLCKFCKREGLQSLNGEGVRLVSVEVE
jgi:Zn finger protein HypA/HybF involved in hydrogenase expression